METCLIKYTQTKTREINNRKLQSIFLFMSSGILDYTSLMSLILWWGWVMYLLGGVWAAASSLRKSLVLLLGLCVEGNANCLQSGTLCQQTSTDQPVEAYI